MTDEEFVRQSWEWWACFDLDSEDEGENGEGWEVQVCDKSASNPFCFGASTPAEAWYLARIFTQQRFASIGDLRKEIGALDELILDSDTTAHDREIYERIMAREQAAFKELQQGMK